MKNKDSLLWFSLRIFGGALFMNILAIILVLTLSFANELLGSFIINFVVTGMGVGLTITYTYGVAWRRGFRELSLVSRGVGIYRKTKGLIAGIIAIIPYILLFIVFVICIKLPFAETAVGIFGLTQIPFTLIFDAFVNTDYIYLFGFIYLIIPISSFIGYVYGYKNISFSKKVMYKKDQQE